MPEVGAPRTYGSPPKVWISRGTLSCSSQVTDCLQRSRTCLKQLPGGSLEGFPWQTRANSLELQPPPELSSLSGRSCGTLCERNSAQLQSNEIGEKFHHQVLVSGALDGMNHQ